MFIHEIENWSSFRWNAERLSDAIALTNRAIGYLVGRLSTIGFDSQMIATVGTHVENISNLRRTRRICRT